MFFKINIDYWIKVPGSASICVVRNLYIRNFLCKCIRYKSEQFVKGFFVLLSHTTRSKKQALCMDIKNNLAWHNIIWRISNTRKLWFSFIFVFLYNILWYSTFEYFTSFWKQRFIFHYKICTVILCKYYNVVLLGLVM